MHESFTDAATNTVRFRCTLCRFQVASCIGPVLLQHLVVISHDEERGRPLAGYYVDPEDYRYYFREGFQRGYDDGYNDTYQYGYSSNGSYGVLGNVLSMILNLQPLR